MMRYGWAGGGGLWLLVGLLLMIALIVLVVWAVMHLSRSGRAATNDPRVRRRTRSSANGSPAAR